MSKNKTESTHGQPHFAFSGLELVSMGDMAAGFAETLQMAGNINMLVALDLMQLAREHAGQTAEMQSEMAFIASQAMTPGDMRAMAAVQKQAAEAAVRNVVRYQQTTLEWASSLLSKIHDAATDQPKVPAKKA